MAINERLIDTEVAAAGNGGGGTGNQEEGLMLHLDANDVDSYDGDGSIWYDIKDHEYTPATNVSEHFNTVIYTGNNSSKSITGLGFQPDLVWVKNRTNANSHNLVDSLRGATKTLFSNATDAESTRSSVTSFDSDGFSLGNYVGVNGNYNYAAWCFKAGGAPSGSDKVSVDGTSYATMNAANLTEGTVSINKLSVNTNLNFSIATYNGNNSTGSVAHGLGVKPELIIIKSTGSTSSWIVYCDEVGATKYLTLNSTDGAATATNRFNNTEPDTNTWTFGTSDNVHTTNEHVVYSFASKRGVSKVGSFIGTGTSGNKIYTGFEPAFIITKRSSSSGANWAIIDNKRSTDSDKNDYLAADTSNAEATSGSGITFNRDGFTFNGASFNTNGATHIYYAVAKSTNETSLIPDTDLELHLDADSFPEKGESGYSNTPSTWTDSSSNSNNGTISGATFDSELGNWLDFDGSNDFVLPSHTPYQSSGALTMAGWINPDTVTQLQGVFSLRGGSSNSVKFFLGVNSDNALRLDSASTSGFITLASGNTNHKLSANKWHHIAATIDYSSKQFALYLDGNLVSSGTNSSIRSGSTFNVDKFYIGANYNSQFFNGKIGQARVYSSALTQDEVRQNYNFTKPSYPNGVDMSKYGAIFDTSTHTNPDVDAFSFDGSNDYFDSSTFNTNLGSSSYTLSAWIYVQGALSGGGAYVIMATIQSGSGLQFDIIKSNGNLRLYHTGGTAVNQQSSSSLSVNTWYHVICIRDRELGKVNFFIDGVAAGSTSIASANGSADGSGFEIGRYNSGYYFNGDIAQVKVFNKAMTTAEAQALFNQNATTFGKTEV